MALDDGTRFEGALRGLCVAEGVYIDAAGGRTAAAPAGERTMGEQTVRKVVDPEGGPGGRERE